MSESITPPTNRPYPPPSNVSAIISRLRNRNLPDRIDGEYLKDAGVPDGTNTRTLFALRFLGLIEQTGEPTPALQAIGVSTDEEYQANLASLVRHAYAEVFATVDPATDSQVVIVNFFRRYTPASQRERMVVFFLGMCREAGIPTLDVPRQRASKASAPSRKASETKSPSRAELPSAPSRSSAIPILAPALDGLVRSLPPVGEVFPKPRRRQWLGMVEATLEYLYLDEMDDDDEDIMTSPDGN